MVFGGFDSSGILRRFGGGSFKAANKGNNKEVKSTLCGNYHLSMELDQ